MRETCDCLLFIAPHSKVQLVHLQKRVPDLVSSGAVSLIDILKPVTKTKRIPRIPGI